MQPATPSTQLVGAEPVLLCSEINAGHGQFCAALSFLFMMVTGATDNNTIWDHNRAIETDMAIGGSPCSNTTISPLSRKPHKSADYPFHSPFQMHLFSSMWTFLPLSFPFLNHILTHQNDAQQPSATWAEKACGWSQSMQGKYPRAELELFSMSLDPYC